MRKMWENEGKMNWINNVTTGTGLTGVTFSGTDGILTVNATTAVVQDSTTPAFTDEEEEENKPVSGVENGEHRNVDSD